MKEEDNNKQVNKLFLVIATKIGWKGLIAIIVVVGLGGVVANDWKEWRELLSTENIVEYQQALKDVAANKERIDKMRDNIENWRIYQTRFQASLTLNRRQYIIHSDGATIDVAYPDNIMNINKLIRVRKT